VVCKCFGLTDGFLKRVIQQNQLHTAEQVTHFTKAGGACGGCIPKIKELIAEVMGEQRKEERKKPEKLTNLRKMQLIQEVLENEVRPQLWADGGDLELLDIAGSTVLIAFARPAPAVLHRALRPASSSRSCARWWRTTSLWRRWRDEGDLSRQQRHHPG